MDLQMQVFEAVAELRSFSRAAERLHMTQPAVSQHIRALEDSLGVRLLERNNKSVSLTRAGEIALRHAKDINGLYFRMREMVNELVHFTGGPLSVGASYTFGEYALPSVLAKLHREYPGITAQVAIGNTAEIAERVRSRELDICIVEGEKFGGGLAARKLADDEMYIAAGAGHPLTDVPEVAIPRLAEEIWAVREPGSGTREAADRMLGEFGIEPVRVMELGSTQLIKETVEAGVGVTLLSRLALRKELEFGLLRLLNVPGMPVRRSFYVLMRKGDLQTRTMEVFMQTLEAVSAEIFRPHSASSEPFEQPEPPR